MDKYHLSAVVRQIGMSLTKCLSAKIEDNLLRLCPHVSTPRWSTGSRQLLSLRTSYQCGVTMDPKVLFLFWHLVNAHEGKAGVVLFAGKTVWSTPERFKCSCYNKGAMSIHFFPFLSFTNFRLLHACWTYTLKFAILSQWTFSCISRVLFVMFRVTPGYSESPKQPPNANVWE